MRSWEDCLPSSGVFFLSVDEVLAIHERVIEKFGGSVGIRDLGLLESALYRPRSGYYEDLSTMAAALFESLVINHPFVDGNKRVAFFATDVFLRLNGWRFDVEPKEAHEFIIDFLTAEHVAFDHLVGWIREAVVRMSID